MSNSIYLMKASGGILFCLNSSANTNPALLKSQFVSSKHFLLQSTFMLLCCDNAWIILIFVESSGALDIATGGGDWIFDVEAAGIEDIETACGCGVLKAFLACNGLALLMCRSSFLMQNPPLWGTITNVFWKILAYSAFGFGFRSLNNPVTVRLIIVGCQE